MHRRTIAAASGVARSNCAPRVIEGPRSLPPALPLLALPPPQPIAAAVRVTAGGAATRACLSASPHRSPLAPPRLNHAGHGLCKEHDQCLCDPNYFGADCSLRTCPYDYAFVDIPAGDLNHDGLVGGYPGEDNQYVLPSQFAGTPAIDAYELFPTDAAKGGYKAQPGEAHFYMECSGKGACNRASGECVCSTGYTGAACQRSEWAWGSRGEGVHSACLSRSCSPHPLFLSRHVPQRLQRQRPVPHAARGGGWRALAPRSGL